MPNRHTATVSAIASCFRGEEYLPQFLENCAQQTIAAHAQIVLVHNDPSDAEAALVADFASAHPGLITHIVVPREPLPVSTNRGLAAAHGEYVCIWNIDDLRTADSLELMVETLTANPDVGFTYGDYLLVDRWRETDGRLVTVPEFDKRAFVRSMLLGPFYMWRKALCREVGLWDEQLRVSADFDYAIRLALATDGKKTPGLLGYYLDAGGGLSTAATPLQPTERTFLELRYGVYDKLDLTYYMAARRYKRDAVLQAGEWTPLTLLAPNSQEVAVSKVRLVSAALRYPLAILRRVARTLRRRL